MKRIITVILILALVLGLCACGAAEDKTTTLEVGYAKEKIMPDQAVPLGGYGKTERRLTTNFLDYLYATCIAFRYGDEIILWYTQDLISSKWVNEARAAVTERTGIPGERVMVCGTHTHSAPDQGSSHPSIGAYKAIYTKAMADAAEAAIADLAPGKLYAGSTTADLNFVRHYLLADGTYGGDNFGNFTDNPIVDHAAENDPEMQLLKVEREGDKQDILVMNWQAHPCKTGGGTKTDISADFIAGVRDAFESQTDYLFAYFTGAAGNQNTSSRIEGEEKTMDKNEFGQELYKIAAEAIPNLQPVEGTGIKITQIDFEADVNHDDEDLGLQARQVLDEWERTNDTTAGNKLARQLGLSSVFHASAVVNRPGRPQRAKMEITAANIAGFAFITAPIEMFAATGMYIKDNSPFATTFVCSCANGAQSYIPTSDAYDYGCYESYTSYFAKGTAELLQVKYVEMLEGLK